MTLLWAALAALNPTTTYHLAPALVAGAYAAGVWQRATPGRLVVVLADAALASGAAVLAGLVLDGLGWLKGGVLVGSSAFAETVLLAGVSGLVAAVVGTVWAARSRDGRDQRKTIAG